MAAAFLLVGGLLIAGAIARFWAWVTGWTRAARSFGPAPTPTVAWSRYAACIAGAGLMRLPVSVGACKRGLVITPWLPFRLATPVLWAPWEELEMAGPHWISYQQVRVRDFCFAIPNTLGDRLRAVILGNRRFDE